MEKQKLRDVIIKRKAIVINDKKPSTVLIWVGKWVEMPICSH